jgi:hypothetical protein
MKLVPIFNETYTLLREGSIKDFNFEYFLSDKFLIPFSRGEITSDYYELIMDFKDEYNLNLDEDEIISHPKYKEFVIKRVTEGINNFKNVIKNIINPTSGTIKIYRGMSVDKNWMEHLKTQGRRLGIYWSWDSDGAINYSGVIKSDEAEIECEINERYINWESTVYQNIFLSGENEITLLKNTKLNINSIKINGETIDISPLKNKTFVA